MVDEVITKQELIDAKRDAHDLGKAVNEKVIVSPRYGEDFKSLPLIAEEFQISSDAAEAAAVSAAESANIAQSSANTAEAAATAATISAGVFDTPEAGVDPVTGVADGAYFNVRSSSDESYVDEYQNVGGVPTPSGKSYPSSEYVRAVKEAIIDPATGKADAEKVFDGNENQHQINKKTIRHVASVSDMLAIQNPFSGQVVITLSYVSGLNKGGAKYTYDATRAAENNGITCINGWVKNNTSRLLASQAGCQEGDFENTDLLNNLILVASTEGIKEVILDGFYKIGQLEKGITTTPFGDENAWWLLKARSNVTVKGRSWSDGLLVAGGLVASNAVEPNTKGYMVFGDYNQIDVENFKIKNFTIDNNGQENLLPEVVGFGAQALCPNVWFQRGKNIGVVDIHFKDNPGHQTIVLDSGVRGAKVVGNKFTDNGAGLLNNNHIVDHSTIYIRATDYTVAGNTFEITGGREPSLNTALELHGVDGHAYGNTSCGYPFAIVRGAYFGQHSKNVLIHDNVFNGVNYGVNMDGGGNSSLEVDVFNNKFNFRSRKPYDGRAQVAIGHVTSAFPDFTPTSTQKIIVKTRGNTFNQPTTDGTWTKFNEFDNAVVEGGKFTEISTNDIFIGFKSGYRLNYANSKLKCEFKDTLINCGSQNTDIKALCVIQNIDAAYANGNIAKIDTDFNLQNCVYDEVAYFVDYRFPVRSDFRGHSTNWILPYGNLNPDSAVYANFEYSVDNVDANKILYAQGEKVFGRITLATGFQYFWKKNGYVGRWNMHREHIDVIPTTPRFFGDIKGDTVTIKNPTTGQPFGAVCTVSGADVNTVGTWKGYGVVL